MKAYLATVQLLVKDEGDFGEAGACDWISGLLSEYASEHGLIDWSYLKVHGVFLSPREVLVPDDYQEGDAFP